jgi:hypothetical protein
MQQTMLTPRVGQKDPAKKQKIRADGSVKENQCSDVIFDGRVKDK